MSERLSWFFKSLFVLTVVGTLFAALIGGGVFYYFSRDLPKIITVEDYRPMTVTRVYASPRQAQTVSTTNIIGPPEDFAIPIEEDETLLIGEYYKERRYVIPYEKIPQNVIRAFISAEDDKFFEHQGINLTSIFRAAIANIRSGHKAQGGSTITQQVAKTLLLTPERSYTRKIKEVILAGRIEKNLTKEQILFLYLNQIYFGRGAYGIQAASKVYFGKDVEDITLEEAATLAGLPKAPARYGPHVNPSRAKERQLYVLRRMLENGFISQEQLTKAASAPIRIYYEQPVNQKYAPHLVEHIRRYISHHYGDRALYEEGLTAYVPSSRKLLLRASESLKGGLENLTKRRGFRGPIRRLLGEEEKMEFIEKSRLDFIKKEVGYQIFTPDGKIDPFASLEEKGVKSEAELLTKGHRYEAMVVKVNDEKKFAELQIGTIVVKLPLKQMRWARRMIEGEKGNPVLGPRPTAPSQVLRLGDIVLVEFLEKRKKAANKDSVQNDLSENDLPMDYDWIVSLEQRPKAEAGLFSIDAKTGFVLAMVGGYDFASSEFNRVTQAKRQAGSAFKPLIYSAAIENGYTPATVILDSPIIYDDEDTGKWKPNNFEQRFYGDTTLRQALIHSRNVPTIKMVQAMSVDHIIDYSKRIGIDAQFNRDLSISLGSCSVTLYNLTKAYATFPRGGKKVRPIFLTKLVDRNGETLEEMGKKIKDESEDEVETLEDISEDFADTQKDSTQGESAESKIVDDAIEGEVTDAEPSEESQEEESSDQKGEEEVAANSDASPEPSAEEIKQKSELEKRSEYLEGIGVRSFPNPEDPEQVIDPRVAYVMSHLMKEVVDYGTGRRARALGRPAGGKTGTTNEYKDAWFMGFTQNVVTGVWVGSDANRSLGRGETGARAALPIWMGYMKEAVRRYRARSFAIPEGVVFASIDPDKGTLEPPNSSRAVKEAFIDGTQPKRIKRRRKRARPVSTSDFYKEDIE